MSKAWIAGALAFAALAAWGAYIVTRHAVPAPAVPEQRLPYARAVIPNDMLNVASPKVGLEVFKMCASCHSNETVQEPNKVGPPLFGIVGAHIARQSGFNYSEALHGMQTQYWTTDELDRWLRFPAGYAPGTTMKFAGLLDPQERWDLISYLMTLK